MNPYDEYWENIRNKQSSERIVDSVVQKAVKVAQYFKDRYGEKNAKFICSRIAPAVKTWTENQLRENGEKIALVNGWVSLEELQKRKI